LFEEITRLPEYYPSKIEKQLLHAVAPRLGVALPGADLIELGSGDCSKASILLAAAARWGEPIRYIPFDICREAIENAAAVLAERFPRLGILGIVADIKTQLHVIPSGRRRVICFLGSTIGNFSRMRTVHFLGALAGLMGPVDLLVLGVDLVKPRRVLERAYNDSRDLTASFNRNVLNVVNALAGTDFDPAAFAHVAFYRQERSRVEMHLRATAAMTVRTGRLDKPIILRCGETIHTENSHKYAIADIASMARIVGLNICDFTVDENGWFALITLRREGVRR
jgi:L-histidine N-alpha-methyltransferase